MAATLTLADLAAVPSGATATVAGTTGGNEVYVTTGDPADPAAGQTWVLKGTRTGDGDVALDLRPGVYWAYVLADGGAAASPPAYVRVTDGLAAVASRCHGAVTDRVRALALPCTERVYDQTFTEDPAVLYPLTVVTPAGASQSNEATLNGRDDWGHPVRVLLRDKVFRYDQTARARFEGWRQAALRAFHNQRLPGVPESKVCKVDLGPLIEPPPGGAGMLMSELTVRCITREPRGLGA